MSAFIVKRELISYLLDAAMTLGNYGDNTFHYFHQNQWQKLTSDNATEVGQKLWDACITNVSQLYPNTELPELPGTTEETFVYTHEPKVRQVDPVQVLKSVQHYTYQSDNTSDWDESEAASFVSALTTMAIMKLPGYDTAVWGVPE